MRFADLGVPVAALLALVWTVVVIVLGSRRSDVGIARLQRRPAYIGGIGAALLVGQAAVVDAVEDGGAVARWDLPVLEWFVNHRETALTAVFRTVSAVGGTVGMAVLAGTAVVLLVVRHRRVHATAVAVAALGAAALNSGFKQLYRLYLGVHWLTDVLTGWLLGGAWLAMCTAALLAYLVRQGRSDNCHGMPAGEAKPSSVAHRRREGGARPALLPPASRRRWPAWRTPRPTADTRCTS